MSTKIVVLVLALVVIIGGVFYKGRLAQAPEDGVINSMPTEESGSMTKEKEGMMEEGAIPTIETGDTMMEQKQVIIEMTQEGFIPSVVTVKKGTIVLFLNKDSKGHWPASAVHPTHQCYPGFDSLKAVGIGESYSFTANMVKACGFHDHLNPTMRGSLTVTE